MTNISKLRENLRLTLNYGYTGKVLIDWKTGISIYSTDGETDALKCAVTIEKSSWEKRSSTDMAELVIFEYTREMMARNLHRA